MERPSGDPPVAVAVVSWNTRDLLARCLESLAGDVEAGRASVWVVDNGSSDGSPYLVREVAPWATLVEPGENIGFGRAVNLVAQRTSSDWIAAANADVALEPGALSALLEGGRDASVGCVAPRLVLPDGQTQHSVYPFPTVLMTLYVNLGLYLITPRLARRLCLESFWDPEEARGVPWAVGAFLCLRREAFEAVGGFDKGRWIYAEDLDLEWRLSDRGWVTRYEPGARARHEDGAATGPAFGEEKPARFMAATYDTIRQRSGGVSAGAVGWLNVLGAAARVIWMEPLARLRPYPWQHRLRQSKLWLRAHGRARHRPAELLRPDQPDCESARS